MIFRAFSTFFQICYILMQFGTHFWYARKEPNGNAGRVSKTKTTAEGRTRSRGWCHLSPVLMETREFRELAYIFISSKIVVTVT